MNLSSFPSAQKYISCRHLSSGILLLQIPLTPKGEFFAPSSTHLQKFLYISRTWLPPHRAIYLFSCFSNSHYSLSSWGRRLCLAKSHGQFSALILLDGLEAFLWLITVSLPGFWDNSFSWLLFPLLANLSASPLLPTLSLPNQYMWQNSGFSP